jgi:hypothetical protein
MAALHSRESRWRLGQAAAGLGKYDLDGASRIVELDERTRQLWGIGLREAVTYAAFLACSHTPDRSLAQCGLDRALEPASGGSYQGQ